MLSLNDMVLDMLLSALVNALLLAGLPFLLYALFLRWRFKIGLREVTERAGLRLGETRFIVYCFIGACLCVGGLVLWPPALEPSVRAGSAFGTFKGLGLNPPTVLMAMLYGFVKTGFPEEFLFRGLIAGSLGRHFSLWLANLLQAFIFLAPHLFLLLIMPEMWGLLIVVFAGALFTGWVRLRSGSMLGPWLIHAACNVTMALSVAIRSVG